MPFKTGLGSAGVFITLLIGLAISVSMPFKTGLGTAGGTEGA